MNPVGRAFIKFHTWVLKKSDGKRMSMGGRLLILKTVGAKSGKSRENPLMYIPHEGGYLLAASMAGAPKSPGWYHNLKKSPTVHVNIEGDDIACTARIAKGDERNELWAKFEAFDKRFANYQKKTDRVIPVVVLTPN